MMSADSKSRYVSGLGLDNSEEGVTGTTDDTVAARSGQRAGDEIVAATIRLDHLKKNEVQDIMKVLEPYNNNIEVLTKKQLDARADRGSFGLGLKDSAKMLNLKKDLSLDASAQAPIVSLDGLNGKINAAQGLGGEIGGHTLNGDLPSLSLKKPSAGAGANFKMPSLGLTGPDIKGDLDSTLKAPNVSVSTPKLDTPNASLNIEKPGIKTGNLKYKAPHFSMPQFNLPQIKTPKGDMDVSSDVDLPSVSGNLNKPNLNLSAPKFDLKSPDLDLNGPKLDMNGPDMNFETPNADIEPLSNKIKWPHKKWKGPKVKGLDADLNADLSAPDFSLTTPKIDGDLSAPDVDIKSPDLDVQTPNLDIDTASGKINWPHHKWKKPKLHGPKADLDLDANLNTPYVDPSLPKVSGGINAPDVDMNLPKAELDMQTPNIDGELPSGKIHWPHWKWKKPKLQGPKADIDADLNTPDLNFSTPKIDGDINVPDAELNLPKADLNGPNVDFQGPDLDMDASGKINWPHRKWKKPKLHGPKADLSADLSSPDVDLSVPKIDGEISTPDIDLNLPKGNVDVDAPDIGKFRFPTLKKPKFLQSGPKVKSPDVDFDANVNAPDLNLPQASFDGPDVDLNLPRADLDIEGNPGKIKWPTLKKPKWAVSGPKIDGELNAPDVNLNAPKADLKSPELDINAPDYDSSGKLKWFNFKKPTFGTLNGPKGDIDAALKVPDFEGGIETPDLNMGMPDIDLPKGNVAAPNVDLKTSDLNLSAPKIGFGAPDLDLNVPKADLRGPDIDLQAPEVNASAGKIKLPKLNLPKFGWSGPRVKGPNLNVDADNVDFPDGNLNLPTADVTGPSLDLPKADLQVPDLNLKSPDLSLSSPKIYGNLSAPTTEPVTLNSPNMDINLPKADLKGPDAQLKTPDLNLDSHLGDFNSPNFKFPKLGLSSPEVEVPSVNPSVKAGIEAPKVNIGTLKGAIEGPGVPNVDANLEKPKFSNFQFPKLTTPSVEGGISPDLDITAEADAEVKGSPKSKSRWPFKWGLRSGSVNEEGSGDDSETDVSDANVEFPPFKTHKLPRNSLNGIGGIEDILSVSKLETEAKDFVVSKGVRLPIINANTKAGGKVDIMERLRMAKEKSHSASSSPIEAKTDLKLSAPSLAVGTSVDPDSSLVRGGTFKVDKPESALALVAPEISTSDENDKLSLSLSNMLGLNSKD